MQQNTENLIVNTFHLEPPCFHYIIFYTSNYTYLQKLLQTLLNISCLPVKLNISIVVSMEYDPRCGDPVSKLPR